MMDFFIVLSILSFLSFIVVLITYYTPACFKLKALISSIDSNKGIVMHYQDIKWHAVNNYTIEYWTQKLPKKEKYLSHHKVVNAVYRIRLGRKILLVSFIMMLLSIALEVFLTESLK